MAGKLFLGFDLSVTTAGINSGTPPYTITSNMWLNVLALPFGVYSKAGFATRDRTIPVSYLSLDAGFLGDGSGAGWSLGAYADSEYWYRLDGSALGRRSRSQWITAEGFTMALARDELDIGNEIYFSADIQLTGIKGTNSSITSTPGVLPMFAWGDLSISITGTEWSSGTSTHTVTFGLFNAGTEVGTIVVPSVTHSTWLFLRVHAKLDAAGVFEANVSGVNSAPFTGDTVATTSLEDAEAIFIHPPVLDSDPYLYLGRIDHIYLDDDSFPLGRPTVIGLTLDTESSAVNMEAYGPGSSTIVDALSNSGDTKAVRALAAGGSVRITTAPGSFTGLMEELIGVEMSAQGVVNRNGSAPRFLQIGFDVDGVETTGDKAQRVTPIFDNTLDPPSAPSTRQSVVEQIFEFNGEKLNQTDFAGDVLVVLRSVTPP